MKKIMSLLLASLMVVGLLSACGGKDPNGFELDVNEPHYKIAIEACRHIIDDWLEPYEYDSFNLIEVYYIDDTHIEAKYETKNEIGNKEIHFFTGGGNTSIRSAADDEDDYLMVTGNGTQLNAKFIKEHL